MFRIEFSMLFFYIYHFSICSYLYLRFSYFFLLHQMLYFSSSLFQNLLEIDNFKYISGTTNLRPVPLTLVAISFQNYVPKFEHCLTISGKGPESGILIGSGSDLNPLFHGRFFRPKIHLGERGGCFTPPNNPYWKWYQTILLYTHSLP